MQEGAGHKLSAAAAAGAEAAGGHVETETTAGAVRASAVAVPGLDFPRYFTAAGIDPFDEVEWELRDAIIGNERGKVVFEQRGVEIPKSWSQ